MPDSATYAAFLGAVLAYQLSGIGPDMMLVISRGVGQGWRAALAAALGCVSAGIVQIPLLAMGLASLVTSTPALYQGLQLLGAVYLIYVGITFIIVRTATATDRPPTAAAGCGPTSRPRLVSGSLAGAFGQGMICNLTNPTVLAFMLAVLPQFVHGFAGSPALQFLVLGATMKATGLVILGAVALTSGAAGNWLARHTTLLVWQQRFAGAVMVALGIRMLLAVAMPGARR
jgi:threonine/homoserine/homoserine lactone efflux protein